MFPFPIATPQGCNIQTFYGSGTVASQKTWNKPVGVSHVYMLLIGGGGNGNTTNNGGGSGAVTVWYGAAQHVPNSLIVNPSSGASVNTTVTARFSDSLALPAALLTANVGSGATAGTAMTANYFAATGFFQSVAGQDGGDNVSASTTTFLSGGGDATSSTVTSNYGYALSAATTNLNGTFLIQPIIVGLGGKATGVGGIGCGGGTNGKGGPGMVLIASW